MMHNTSGFTLPEAQALVGRAVRAKRKGGWQIEDGVVLEHGPPGASNGKFTLRPFRGDRAL
jgi:hypothetical protein